MYYRALLNHYILTAPYTIIIVCLYNNNDGDIITILLSKRYNYYVGTFPRVYPYEIGRGSITRAKLSTVCHWSRVKASHCIL